MIEHTTENERGDERERESVTKKGRERARAHALEGGSMYERAR